MEMSYLKLEIYCGDVIDVETFTFYVNMTSTKLPVEGLKTLSGVPPPLTSVED